jgi:hypothetical protein
VGTYAKVLDEVAGLEVDLELAALGVLGEVESRDLGNVLILALTLLLLELEGDTTDGTARDTLHQVGGVTGNLKRTQVSRASLGETVVGKTAQAAAVPNSHLVAETLGSDDGNLVAETLVGLEVIGQSGVVLLDDAKV